MTASQGTAAVAALLVALSLAPGAEAKERIQSRTVESQGPLKVGGAAPAFAGFDLDGRMVSLRELLTPAKGPAAGAVVVSFFATWCVACKDHLPAIDRVASQLKDRNVRVVLVAYGQKAEEVGPFLTGTGLALPVLLDPFTKISARFGVDKALPRTFVLDAKGTIRTIYVVEGDDFEQSLKGTVERALH